MKHCEILYLLKVAARIVAIISCIDAILQLICMLNSDATS